MSTTIGKGITVEVKDGKAVIVIDLKGDSGLSSTGKSRIVASSEGNAPLPGTDIRIGINAFRKV